MGPIAEGKDKINKNMKIVVWSDTHMNHSNINLPPGDILIHCGDISNSGFYFYYYLLLTCNMKHNLNIFCHIEKADFFFFFERKTC